jgi:sec-independent protein translocase protein TatC
LKDKELSFWEHLDVLRSVMWRILVAIVVMAAVMFCLRDTLFSIVLAPSNSDFITFRLTGTTPFQINLINTLLTEQFYVHIKVAIYAALLFVSPYVIYEIFHFISPALYENEKYYATRICTSAYAMFVIGTLLNYFLVFPFTLHFLGTYQVSTDIHNMLTLESYTDTLICMSLMLGVVFELPIICWLLSAIGILKRNTMRQYRKHAIVVILIVAAIITPTTDAMTLFIVSLPIWILYEISTLIIKD